MASCLLTANWECPDCDAKWNIPGLERDQIYIFNKSEITAFVSTVPGEISDFTMAATKVGFQVCVHKNSASWTEELQVGETSGNFYNQSFTFRVIDNTTSFRNQVENMVDADLVFIVKQKDGSYYVLGEQAGLQMSENVKGSGAAAGDETGDLITFTGEGRKAKKFFDTNAATTAANIAALI